MGEKYLIVQTLLEKRMDLVYAFRTHRSILQKSIISHQILQIDKEIKELQS